MTQTPRRVLVARAVTAALAKSTSTEDELAVAAGIPLETLRERLAGREPFDVDQLEAVGVALGVDVVTLLGPDTRPR